MQTKILGKTTETHKINEISIILQPLHIKKDRLYSILYIKYVVYATANILNIYITQHTIFTIIY